MSHPANDKWYEDIQEKLFGFSNDEILEAIKSLGIESLCGVSHMDHPDEVWDYLIMMEPYEIGEIEDLCQHRYNKAKEMIEDDLR